MAEKQIDIASEKKDQESELEQGMTQVLEAMTKIASGNHEIRIEEASKLESMAKLKHMVNQTAINLGEITDVAHEFAVGLAEHFEVLRRASAGDLDARVRSTSKTELLEFLKNITNNMIESVSEEISERKRVEEKLQQSEQRYRELYEGSRDGYAMVNMEGKIIESNSSFRTMLGYGEQELKDKNYHDMTPKKWHAFEAKILEQQVFKRGYSDVYEKEYIRKDGAIVPIDIRTHVVKDHNQKPIGMWAFVRDIGERQLAKEEKVRLEAQLQQAQKMEAIGTLAGGIAHDFNNILGAIFGYTELAQLDAPETGRQKANLAQVLRAADRAKSLVQQILAFSRQSEQEEKAIQLTPIIKETIKMLRASIPTTIEIRQNIKQESGTVMADPTQIHQVLMNLCTNAAHAMRENGGVLEISLQDLELDSETAVQYSDLTPGPYVLLTITDTGHGMDEAVKNRIFDPYFTTKEKGVGTGLGLAAVHGIVSSCRGVIIADSAPGEGTTFDVFLPRIETKVAQETEPLETLCRGNERVLFVDDEETLVSIGRQILERLGYHVVGKTSPIEALEAFREKNHQFDLVITDQTMPHMTGDVLAKEIMRIQPDMPVVLCSGYCELISEDRVKALGIREFVRKPLVVRELAKTVRKVLDDR